MTEGPVKPTPLSPQVETSHVEMRPARRFSLAWLAPIVALVAVGVLLYQARQERGPRITIRFADGHDLRLNDPVSYRGVRVGKVRDIKLSDDLRQVVIEAELTREAGAIATEGSRFWIVRPELSLTRISGVETLLGPRYLAVLPGDGPPATEFDGLAAAPLDVSPRGQGLVVVLHAARAGSLQAGSPVYYRDVEVGAVTATRLADNSTMVEIVAEITPRYGHLVRTNSRFWNAGGVGMNFGFSGLRFQADSLQNLITGGIAFATPTKPGERVSNGARFDLATEPETDWLKWSPLLEPE